MLALFPLLNTQRLSLKQFSPADVQYVYQGLSHPDVIRYYGVSYGTLEDTQKQMEWFRELEANGTGIWWAIWSATSKEFYGAIGYNNLSKYHCKAELGFWLLPAYWGKGIITESLEIVLAYGFEKLKLHRIEALVETGNTGSCKSLLRAGFKHEGNLRECEIKNRQYISIDIFARLVTD